MVERSQIIFGEDGLIKEVPVAPQFTSETVPEPVPELVTETTDASTDISVVSEVSEALPVIVTGGDDVILEVPASEGEQLPVVADIPVLDWSRVEINEDGDILRILDMTTVEEVKEFLASHTR